MTTRNNKVREAILRLAGMREGWTLLADTIPDEFLNQVSIRISELEAQLAAMTSERDSESRWAKEYHDRAKELDAQLAEMKAAQKLAVDNWTLEAQNLKVAENKLTSIVLWLERYQPDVFQRGLWDALNA